MTRLRAGLLVAPLLVLPLGSPVSAGDPPASTPSASGAAAVPILARDATGWRVEWDGRSQAIGAADGARLEVVAALSNGWLAAGTRVDGERVELVLLADTGSGARELPAPGDVLGAVRERPRPVVGDGTLEGVAWLEGGARETYAVR